MVNNMCIILLSSKTNNNDFKLKYICSPQKKFKYEYSFFISVFIFYYHRTIIYTRWSYVEIIKIHLLEDFFGITAHKMTTTRQNN